MNRNPPNPESQACFGDLARAGRTDAWTYGLAFVVILGGWIVLEFATILGLAALYKDWSWSISSAWSAFLLAIDGQARDTIYTLVVLASVAVMLPPLFVAVRFIHRRPWRSLLTGRRRFDWTLMLYSLGLGLILNGALFFAMAGTGGAEIVFDWDPAVWLLALVLLPLPLLAQVTAEETLFRGYIYQWVGLFTANTWVRILIPAGLFAVMHLPNPELQSGGYWALADYLLFSLYAGFLVYRTNGLEAAIGMHAAINLLVSLIITYPDSVLPGAAPWALEEIAWDWMALLSLIAVVLHYVLLLRLCPVAPPPSSKQRKPTVPLPVKRNADSLIETLALKDKRVLDVGCGGGHIARLMAGQGAHVIGLDPNPVQLRIAEAETPVADETYQAAGGEALPFDDESMELVVLFNSLHHLPPETMAPALREAARVLVPGGHLYISEPVAEGPFFTLMQPIDDETEVRALALAAIDNAEDHGLREITRAVHLHPMRYPDYETFAQRIGNIDPTRRAKFAALDARMRAAFEELGETRDDGVWFHQPTRTHLLGKGVRGLEHIRSTSNR
ncbi:methyltransferase domain-containing protein [Magnetospira sp. QH-2]|uniref:methyltransferase domain-containing protein n=1 Tax=Magnetospira sp. (strain QH-2) TaxID=1288970 RepID=UPI0003E80BF5|nr:methyltransferase domain-containing protein [Magnetospira sp. QH-2]CCQ74450.1 membrane protein of unknown function [Magnetospira sp. QH-2]